MNWLSPDIDWMEYAKSKGVLGFCHPSELAVLVRLAEGKDYLEVGSFRGLSAWCVAHTAAHVTCIDTFRAGTNGQSQQPEQTTYAEFCRNLAPFWGKVTCLPFSSEEAAEKIPEAATFDVIFIDAMHTYEDVLADIKRWWPRVRPGGVLAGHDYAHDHFPGVKQAFDEFFGHPSEPHIVTLRVIHKYNHAIGGVPVRSPEQMHAAGWIPYGPVLCTVCGEEKVPNEPHECEEYSLVPLGGGE